MIRVLLAIDGAAALVILYFFFIGLADGTVSARNAGLWLGTLATLIAVLGGGYALHASGWRRAALAVLLVLAIPALLCGLFVLGLIAFQPRWN